MIRQKRALLLAPAVLLASVFWIAWHVVALEIDAGVMLSYWWVVLLFLGGLLLPQWIALERWIFRPLSRLKAANVEMLEGDLEKGFVEPDSRSRNEIGGLIRSHNAMLADR